MTYVCPRTRGTAKVVCVLLFILAAVTGVFSSLGIEGAVAAYHVRRNRRRGVRVAEIPSDRV